MVKILFALLVVCAVVTSCASEQKANSNSKTRSAAVETLPAEDK